MTTPTIDAFWKQLAASGMVEADRVAQLAREHAVSRGPVSQATAAGDNIQDLTAWMVSQQVLTRDQCETLLRRATQSIAPPPFAPPVDPSVAEAAQATRSPSAPPSPMVSPSPAASPSAPSPLVSDAAPRLSKRYVSKSQRRRAIPIALGACLALLIAGVVAPLFMTNDIDDGKAAEQTSTAAEDLPSAAPSPSITPGSTPIENAPTSARAPKEVAPPPSPPTTVPKEIQVVDDGETLWSSPTAGKVPTLRHVPTGTQIVFMLRPSELLADDAGRSLLQAMGPAGTRLATWTKAATDLELNEIRRLDIMLGESSGPSPLLAIVVYPEAPAADDKMGNEWTARRREALDEARFEQSTLGYHFPATDRFVIAPAETLTELQELGEDAAPLSPPMTQLLETVDENRHCNILFATSYVRSARESLYGDYLAPLREGIDWMFGSGDEVQAGLLSFHLENQLFTELRLFGVRDILPRILARQFHERIDQTPRRVKDHLKTLSIHSYSRDVLWDFPEMLQSVARYTRHDREGRQGVVRCYLPKSAASHLASAIELTLWETARAGAGETTPAVAKGSPAPKTLEEQLAQVTSLSFDKSSLEKSLQTLSEDIRVRIVILGHDLQLDGITKNQSFGIDLRDRPAREILNTIVQLANPDKTATKLSDPAQKLIYLLKPKYEDGADAIVITTRAQAAERQDTLPPEFVGP